jgi:hypothetical protein
MAASVYGAFHLAGVVQPLNFDARADGSMPGLVKTCSSEAGAPTAASLQSELDRFIRCRICKSAQKVDPTDVKFIKEL